MPVLAAVALAVSLLGWASYIPVAKTVSLRRTLWPTRAMEYLAVLLACLTFALPPEDKATNLLLVSLTCLSFAAFTLVYYTALRLPIAKGRPEVGKLLPAFELTGEDGKPLGADKFTGKGPVLFVFFRGFW